RRPSQGRAALPLGHLYEIWDGLLVWLARGAARVGGTRDADAGRLARSTSHGRRGIGIVGGFGQLQGSALRRGPPDDPQLAPQAPGGGLVGAAEIPAGHGIATGDPVARGTDASHETAVRNPADRAH